MPNCDGVPPDGRCPHNATGRGVKHSQGDLMLCDACDAVRFPPAQGFTSKVSSNSHNRRQPIKTRSDTKQQQQQQKSVSDTATPASAIQSSSSNADINCAVCLDIADDNYIACDVCKDRYHQHCSGLPNDVFDVLLSIVGAAGWVCNGCRAISRCRLHRVDNLSTIVSKAAEEIADMRSVINSLKAEIDCLKAENNAQTALPAVTVPATDRTSSSNQSASVPNLHLQICKTLNDFNRRKRNVIISGLPESTTGEPDENVFSQFCEEHMDTKPSLASMGCRRLGRVPDPQGRPRRLLVHLNSESCASDLLKAAKSLRYSSDDRARSVFINPDLDPASAKLAYERREQRRNLRRERDISNTVNNATTPSTISTAVPPSFPIGSSA